MKLLKKIPLVLLALFLWFVWWALAVILITLIIIISYILPKPTHNIIVKATCTILTYSALIFPTLKSSVPGEVPFPVIYVANHVSFFDLFISGTLLPGNPRGLEMASHFRLFFYGWFLKRFGQVPIEAGNKVSVRKAMLKIKDIIENNERSILIMPEGARTFDGKVGKFKNSPFYLSRISGFPIVPVVFKGLFELNNRNSIIIKPGRCEVILLDPVFSKDFVNDEAMSKHVKNVIQKELLK